MDTGNKENYGSKKSLELRFDSRRCWKCSDDVSEDRFEDLVGSVGA